MTYTFFSWVLNQYVNIRIRRLFVEWDATVMLARVESLHELWQQSGSVTVEEVREAFVAGKAFFFDMNRLEYTILSVNNFFSRGLRYVRDRVVAHRVSRSTQSKQ